MKIKFILTVLISILLSACAQWISVNPLSPPSKLDEKLKGVWKLDSKEGDVVYLHMGEKSKNTMIALSVEHKKDGNLDIMEIPFFITRTNKNSYFNIRYEDIEKDAKEKEKGFIFVKYSFTDNNTLFFYQFDQEVIQSAVKSGKLKGEVFYKKITLPAGSTEKNDSVSEKKIDNVKITDTSENMIKFFETEGSKFSPEVLKFIRVR